MKKIFILLLIFCTSMQIAMAQADPQINMNAVTNSVMPGTQGQINVTICNNGPNTVPANRLRPLISTASANIIITGATNTDGSPLTGFTIQAQTNGSIRLLYNLPLANNSCVSFYVTVQGVTPSAGPGEFFNANLGFQAPVPGNNTGNDNGATTVLVAPLLPVKISIFSGYMDKCTAMLRWTSVTEQNSSRYDVEHSTDGLHFTKVGAVASHNAANGASYTFRFANTAPGANYFRISAVDFDGTISVTNVVKLTANCNKTSISIAPNPAQDAVTISGLSGKDSILINDAAGRLMTSVISRSDWERINISGYARGTYIVRVAGADGTVTAFKLVKE